MLTIFLSTIFPQRWTVCFQFFFNLGYMGSDLQKELADVITEFDLCGRFLGDMTPCSGRLSLFKMTLVTQHYLTFGTKSRHTVDLEKFSWPCCCIVRRAWWDLNQSVTENLAVFLSLLGTQLPSVDTNYLSTGLLHTSSGFLVLHGWIHTIAARRPTEFIKHFCKTSKDLRNLYRMTVPSSRTSEFRFCFCPQDEGCYREVCVNQAEKCLHVTRGHIWLQ